MIINFFIPFFAYFSKLIYLGSVFSAEMNSACKNSHENVLIRVFFHAKFISALKTEPKYMGFEKYAKKGIKKFIIIIF